MGRFCADFVRNKTLSLTAGWSWTFFAVHGIFSVVSPVCFVFFVFLGMSGRLSAERLCYRANASPCVSPPVCEDDELLIVWPISTSSSSLLHLSAFPSTRDNKSAPGGIMLTFWVFCLRCLILKEAVQGLRVFFKGLPTLLDLVLMHNSHQCEEKDVWLWKINCKHCKVDTETSQTVFN